MTETHQSEKFATRTRFRFLDNPKAQQVLRATCWTLALACVLQLTYTICSDAFQFDLLGRPLGNMRFAVESEAFDMILLPETIVLGCAAVLLDRCRNKWLRRFSLFLCIMIFVYGASGW